MEIPKVIKDWIDCHQHIRSDGYSLSLIADEAEDKFGIDAEDGELWDYLEEARLC